VAVAARQPSISLSKKVSIFIFHSTLNTHVVRRLSRLEWISFLLYFLNGGSLGIRKWSLTVQLVAWSESPLINNTPTINMRFWLSAPQIAIGAQEHPVYLHMYFDASVGQAYHWSLLSLVSLWILINQSFHFIHSSRDAKLIQNAGPQVLISRTYSFLSALFDGHRPDVCRSLRLQTGQNKMHLE
jgi:hypothetical protein